ncbi:cuticular protein analogous to peritrophins 1-j precursor [Lasius niger]|uniref:Cuticular protein analogous to peritrophins 1-j n=1 Tax=Lasius niger TaxID=67767 RepID=A0A0J7L9J9_LASNI|nr:cuticular protein analogous to peritrophins 1-j precursor [Lasius niger]
MTKASRDVEHARLPEFLTELDLSSLEASEEDVEALKKIVKRLAPEKNGEYQVYQVFFGNEDLLKEWLKGADVTGQPGVDYPALTSIPATSFSCRGLRGGYYADLETNCQVFHICDNGRKISFLCPNVDCSKSTELYEQSAEQLAEEEKKRADARKIKSEYHRAEQQDNADYYETQNVDYDGRQNGRTNPYGQSAENSANALRTNEKTGQTSESFNQQQPKQRQYHDGGSNYQTNNRQRNQLVDTQGGGNQSQKSTPQFAESAAFVSNRGNRFNSGKSENNRQFYYHSYDYHDHSTTVDYRDRETTTLPERNQEAETVSFTPKTNAPSFPGPTFAPIYKPRTTTLPPYETTLQYTPTTETSFYSTSYYGQDDIPETTVYANIATVTSSSVDEYSSTESYATHSNPQTPAAIGRVPPLTGNYQNQQYVAHRVTNQRDTERDTASFATARPDPWRASSQSFRQNSISSTEKPWKSTNAYQPNGSTSKTLSPYDTSFTYKQGKVLSTLGPYVPSTLTNYRITASSLLPKMKSSPPATSRPKDRATYLPEASSKRPTTLEDRPYAEREHALSMLHSLQGLENNANALYFATASDNLDLNGTSEFTASVENREHTIASYAELFNLNNALEGNATIAEFAAEVDNIASEIEDDNDDDDDDDLEIEQSEGPLNGAKRSNNTKLRELAQVFTHALSAYLQDPDTFKKVLTEIRPTQPSATTTDGDQYETTTLYPTTAEEYSSVTKEKDEVLDFSDDTDASRRRKPSTVFSTTLQPPTTTDRSHSAYYTTPYDEYYSTSETRRPIYYPSTTLLPPGTSSYESEDYVESSTQNGNTFAFEVNRAFTTTTDENRDKISDSHNKTARTFQPYGKNVKPKGATPISNYAASSTLASFQQPVGTTSSSWSRGSAGDRPIRSTTPLSRSKPSYDTASTTVQPFRIRYYDSTTTSPEDRKTSPESLVTARSSYVNDVTPYTATVVRATSGKPTGASSTRRPNSLNNDHWTSSPMVTQLWETTVFVDPRHINHGLQSTVDVARSPTTDNTIGEETEPPVAATTTRSPTLFTDVDLDGTTEARTTTSTPSPWQWATNGNDSPVTFTLLPTTFAAENTATPTPLITTRSSITTTITSSVTSTNSVSRDNLASTLLPFAANAFNATENEVIKAQEMFGKLNETSSNTLMRVMKQADSNETVRQLVLLLISYCNGPKDKTTEQEREQLLDALLRLPVNEFTSEESREIIAGISRLNLSSGKTRAVILSNSTTTTTAPRTSSSVRPTPFAPSITTFRSKTGRRFRTTTESAHSFARRSDDAVQTDTNNSLAEDETIASDSRALELLRSLYTIAAKWG